MTEKQQWNYIPFKLQEKDWTSIPREFKWQKKEGASTKYCFANVGDNDSKNFQGFAEIFIEKLDLDDEAALRKEMMWLSLLSPKHVVQFLGWYQKREGRSC